MNLLQYGQNMSQYKSYSSCKSCKWPWKHLISESDVTSQENAFISTVVEHNLTSTEYHITNHLSTIKIIANIWDETRHCFSFWHRIKAPVNSFLSTDTLNKVSSLSTLRTFPTLWKFLESTGSALCELYDTLLFFLVPCILPALSVS